jgi:predicted nucleic acid-binding protein
VSVPVIVDAGPLVAFLVKRDRYHRWVREQFARLPGPMISCEPALAKASHLIARAGGTPDFILEAMRRGRLLCPFRLEEEVEPVQRLLSRYRDVPMSLADACLVRLAELYASSPVLTLDQDFAVYRKHGRQVIPLIAPG